MAEEVIPAVVSGPIHASNMWIWIIVGIVVVGAGTTGVYYYTSSHTTNTTSGVLKDLQQLQEGQTIGKNSPTSWADSLCAYFTLDDAKAVLGQAAYLPSDGFTSNVCGYHIQNGSDSFYEPSAGVVILYRDYSVQYADIMHDSSIKSGAIDVPNIGDWVTVKATSRGNADLTFYNKGVLGGISVNNAGTPEQNINIAKEIAKRVIPKLPQ
jgi:hypothetical protein